MGHSIKTKQHVLVLLKLRPTLLTVLARYNRVIGLTGRERLLSDILLKFVITTLGSLPDERILRTQGLRPRDNCEPSLYLRISYNQI